jgi:predicted transcriptional regulator
MVRLPLHESDREGTARTGDEGEEGHAVSNVTAHDGTVVTDGTLDRWFEEAESGRLPGRAGKTRPGRPLVSDAPLEPVTVRLDASSRDKLRRMAERRRVSRAQVMRELIDAAPM